MKIDKSYRLDEFVDKLESGFYHEEEVATYVLCYNTFLKQPPKMGLFVNPYEYPIDIFYRPDEGVQKQPQECYLHDLEQWQEAEKQIIFPGFKQYSSTVVMNDELGVRIRFENDKAYIGCKPIRSLYELFNQLSKHLPMQNVEI